MENTNIKEDQELAAMAWPDPYYANKEANDFLYYRRCIDYAVHLYKNSYIKQKAERAKVAQNALESIQRDIDAANGVSNVQYVDYKLGFHKVNRMIGEWLGRSLNGTVYSLNGSSAKRKKDIAEVHMGLAAAAEHVKYLRDNQMANPFGGMESQYEMGETPESFMNRLNPKQANEMILQSMLNDAIKVKKIRDPLIKCLLDFFNSGCVQANVSLDATGKLQIRNIPSERIITPMSNEDDFFKNAPFKGERRPMTYAQLIQSFPELITPKYAEQLAKVKKLFGSNPGSTNGGNGVGDMENINGELYVNTYTIQWPSFFMSTAQRYRNPETDVVEREFFNDYEKSKKNIRKYQSEAKNKRYELEVKYRKQICRGTFICDGVYLGMGLLSDQIYNPNDYMTAETDYETMVFMPTMGKITSLRDLIHHLSHEYNMTRLGIRREIAKFKGVQVAYDEAFMPRGEDHKPLVTFEQHLQAMYDKGMIRLNSANDGVLRGAQGAGSIKNFVETIDIGVSQGIELLLKLAYDIEDTVNRLIGFNDERMGETAATTTVTNANNNLISSQNSTAPLVYYFDRFTENVLGKCVEKLKISWLYYRKDEGETVLGSEAYGILEADDNMIDDYFATYLGDSRREEASRNRLSMRADQAIASGQVRIQDVARSEMADTLAEATAILDKSYELVRDDNYRMQQAQNESAAQMNQAKIDSGLQGKQIDHANDKDLQQQKYDLEARNAGKAAGAALIQNADAAEKQVELEKTKATFKK